MYYFLCLKHSVLSSCYFVSFLLTDIVIFLHMNVEHLPLTSYRVPSGP